MSPRGARDLAVTACAISAGVHAALVPEHFREGAGAGGGFAASAVLLGVLAIALTLLPHGAGVPAAAALTLGGLLVAYGLALTTGLPFLHADPETVDGLAVATKAVEAAGLVGALRLVIRPRAFRPHMTHQPKGATP